MRNKLLAGLKDEEANQNDQEEIDWDNLNSDELDSEDLDNLEQGKAIKQKTVVAKDYVEDVGKKLIENKKQQA